MNAALPPEIHNELGFFRTINIIGGAMLSEVTMYHGTLYRKVDSLGPASKAQNPRFPKFFKLAETHTPEYKSLHCRRDSIGKCFCSLVRWDDETAQWLNLNDEQREHVPNAGSAGRTEQHPSASWPLQYRMGLVQVMETIFSIDEERQISIAPDSTFYKCDILGEESYQMRDIRSERNDAVNGG